MGNLIKFLRVYPGLQSEFKFEINGISFNKIEELDLSPKQLSDTKSELEKFKIDKSVSLDKKPLVATVIESENYKNANRILKSVESVLFFIANQDRLSSATQIGITFHLFKNGSQLNYGGEAFLKVNPLTPEYIEIDQYQFLDMPEKMSSKILTLFEGMNSEAFLIEGKSKFSSSNALLIRSLEWYNRGVALSIIGDEKFAIISFATAFEAFFDIKTLKSESLGYAVQRYLGDDQKIRTWTQRFYQARNYIVHGAQIALEDLEAIKGTNIMHSRVAKKIIEECILRQLHITDGLEYSLVERNAAYDNIVNEILVTNQERFKILLKPDKFQYDQNVGDITNSDEFYKTLFSLTSSERVNDKELKKRRKLFLNLTKILAIIVVNWTQDVINKGNVPIFYSPINKDKSSIKSHNPIDELQEVIKILTDYNPNGGEDIFLLWVQAFYNFKHSYMEGHPFVMSKSAPFGILNIIEYVMKNAIHLG